MNEMTDQKTEGSIRDSQREHSPHVLELLPDPNTYLLFLDILTHHHRRHEI